MISCYKNWNGKWPFVILINSKNISDLLYYETGFEQLHPLPEIHTWMKEREQIYLETWKVVKVTDHQSFEPEWAFCFETSEMRDMFALKWL